MQKADKQETSQDKSNEGNQSLELISNNIANALFGNSATTKDNDINCEKNIKENTESELKNDTNNDTNINNQQKNGDNEITDSQKDNEGNNTEKITDDLSNPNTGKLQSNLISPPLEQFVNSLESSSQDKEKNENQTNKDIKSNNTINSNRSSYSSSRSQSSSYSTSGSTQSKPQTANSKRKTQNNNQPPKLPGKLPQIVIHSPDSLTYKALTLQSLPPMNRETRSSVILDLSSYIDQCSQEGMISEANYIQEVSESVKQIQTPRKYEAQQLKLKEDLDNCQNEIEAQNSYWDEQERTIENDYQTLVDELDDRLNNDLETLDREWEDPKKALAYSKPSSTLLNYRYVVNKLIITKDFTNIPQIGKIMSKKHDEEVLEASLRMKSDYKKAENNLITKYQKEKETIDKMRQSKLDNLTRMKEKSLMPMQSRKKLKEAQCTKLKALQMKNQKAATMPISALMVNFDSTTMNDLMAQPKLKLPPMKTQKRSITSLSANKAATFGGKMKNDTKILNKTSKSLNTPLISQKTSSRIIPRSKSRHDLR